MVEIAERERVGSRYVRRLLRLAFLAPEIVEATTAGDQPPELTAEALAERIDHPLLVIIGGCRAWDSTMLFLQVRQ